MSCKYLIRSSPLFILLALFVILCATTTAQSAPNYWCSAGARGDATFCQSFSTTCLGHVDVQCKDITTSQFLPLEDCHGTAEWLPDAAPPPAELLNAIGSDAQTIPLVGFNCSYPWGQLPPRWVCASQTMGVAGFDVVGVVDDCQSDVAYHCAVDNVNRTRHVGCVVSLPAQSGVATNVADDAMMVPIQYCANHTATTGLTPTGLVVDFDDATQPTQVVQVHPTLKCTNPPDWHCYPTTSPQVPPGADFTPTYTPENTPCADFNTLLRAHWADLAALPQWALLHDGQCTAAGTLEATRHTACVVEEPSPNGASTWVVVDEPPTTSSSCASAMPAATANVNCGYEVRIKDLNASVPAAGCGGGSHQIEFSCVQVVSTGSGAALERPAPLTMCPSAVSNAELTQFSLLKNYAPNTPQFATAAAHINDAWRDEMVLIRLGANPQDAHTATAWWDAPGDAGGNCDYYCRSSADLTAPIALCANTTHWFPHVLPDVAGVNACAVLQWDVAFAATTTNTADMIFKMRRTVETTCEVTCSSCGTTSCRAAYDDKTQGLTIFGYPENCPADAPSVAPAACNCQQSLPETDVADFNNALAWVTSKPRADWECDEEIVFVLDTQRVFCVDTLNNTYPMEQCYNNSFAHTTHSFTFTTTCENTCQRCDFATCTMALTHTHIFPSDVAVSSAQCTRHQHQLCGCTHDCVVVGADLVVGSPIPDDLRASCERPAEFLCMPWDAAQNRSTACLDADANVLSCAEDSVVLPEAILPALNCTTACFPTTYPTFATALAENAASIHAPCHTESFRGAAQDPCATFPARDVRNAECVYWNRRILRGAPLG